MAFKQIRDVMGTTDREPLDRYRIDRPLGAGGMGIVYLAHDTQLDRRVAIKKLRRDATSASAHQRIQREARLLAKLGHGNIVQLYDVIEERDGIALVMEYVEGYTLGQWMRERPLSLEEKLGILLQICHGLEKAHALGIIHRDLKPDNILIRPDRPATAKITDFGIAKSWHEDSDLTREQHIAGSWGLMSPEQAQGKPLDNRSDLFTLGILAYRLLCGQNPFGEGDNTYVIVDRIVRHPHPPAARLNPELPHTLCKLLDRLMAKNPEHRPGSAGEIAAALGDVIAGLGDSRHERRIDSKPGAAITAESFYRKRNRRGTAFRAAALTVATIAALATAAFFHLSGPPREKGGQYIAVVFPEMARESRPQVRTLHSNVLNAVRDELSNRKGLYLVPISESRALRDKPLGQMADALNIQLLLNPEIACREKACDLSLQLIDAQDLSVIADRSFVLNLDTYLAGYAKTLQQVDYLLPDYPLRHPRPELQISEADYQRYLELKTLHYEEQQNAEILPALEKLQQRAPFFAHIYSLHSQGVFLARFNNANLGAVERLEKLLAKAPAEIADTPEFISARLNLAETQHDWEEADRQLERLKIVLPSQAQYYHRKALDYQLRGEYEKALEAAERALSHRTGSNYLMQKAIALSYLGDMKGAKPILQQLLETDDENMDARSFLAANELEMGHAGETIRLLKSVDSVPLSPLDTHNLCNAYYLQKNFRRAIPCFEKLRERNPYNSELLLLRAEMARAQGHRESARRLTERAIEETSHREGWENKLILALARAQLGEHQEAVETLIEIRRQAPDDTYVNHIRAQIYITTGDLPLAEAHVRRTLELGLSPLWYNTPPFARLCTENHFEKLRRDYPDLCTDTEMARK